MTGIRISARSFALLATTFVTQVASYINQIGILEGDVEALKERESDLVKDLSDTSYRNGELQGQVTDLTERLALSEESNRNIFNQNEKLLSDNKALITQVNDLTAENDSLKEGKPVVAASAKNVRSLIQALILGDKLIVGEAVHKLMDIPLTEAIDFAEEAVKATALMDSPLEAVISGVAPKTDDEDVVTSVPAEVERQVG